jgi:hypothetical protein
VTAARKISEAENMLAKMEHLSDEKLRAELDNFLRVIHEIFFHLLDEYNIKFGCNIERIGLEKFKVKAKKGGNLDAINFLIWYEKGYKRLKDNPEFGHLLDKQHQSYAPMSVFQMCSNLLKDTKSMIYYAYEHF